MAAFKKCKVCGKEYEYCHTLRNPDIFRWQDVACSPECGAAYFEAIRSSRKPKTPNSDPNIPEDKTLKTYVSSDGTEYWDEYDELFEEFFEYDDDE